MTKLGEYLRANPLPEAAVQAFASDMEVQYKRSLRLSTSSDQWVQCDWIIEYQRGGQKTEVFLNLVFMLFGHFAFSATKYKFHTFHLLTTKETQALRRAVLIRKAFLPFVTFGTVLIGFLFFFFLIGAAIFLPTDQTPMTLLSSTKLVGMLLVVALIFWIAIKVQIAMGKIGRPPHTSEFTDQRIKMANVSLV